MNAEKELLLALLIEKYGLTKLDKITPAQLPIAKKRRRRRRNSKTHQWTGDQKVALVHYRQQGMSFADIATRLGQDLSYKQMDSMYRSLIKRGALND